MVISRDYESHQEQYGFTFQSGGFIAESNELGAKVDEILHRRLSRNKVRKNSQWKVNRTRIRNRQKEDNIKAKQKSKLTKNKRTSIV
jgi:hypothetical protein